MEIDINRQEEEEAHRGANRIAREKEKVLYIIRWLAQSRIYTCRRGVPFDSRISGAREANLWLRERKFICIN